MGDPLGRWPTLEQPQGAHPIPPRWRFSQPHTCRSQERTSNSIAAIKQTINATQDQVLREACVLTALSLVAVLATLRAQIAIFGAVSPNSLAPASDNPKTARFRKPGASLQPGYFPRRLSHRNDGGHRGVVTVWTGSTDTLVF